MSAIPALPAFPVDDDLPRVMREIVAFQLQLADFRQRLARHRFNLRRLEKEAEALESLVSSSLSPSSGRLAG